MPVALVGRVPVNVTSEGGSISVGDFLTTSSTPGKAMKATRAGRVIGMALGSFDGEKGQVMVQVLNTFWNGPQAGGLQEPEAEGGVQEPPAEDAKADPTAKPVEAASAALPAAPAVKPAAPVAAKPLPPQERLAAPLGFWIALGSCVVGLAIAYGFFSFARLEIFKMLLGSFFPLALLIWELCFGKFGFNKLGGGAWKAAFKAQWPSWVVLLAGTLFFLFNDNYLSQMERSAEFNTLQGNIATQLAAFAYLLRQWALPLWLNIDPDLPLLRDLSGSLLQTLFFLAAFALMLACWRRRPWLGFALAWAIIQLLPLHLLLPRLDIANDRQLYLACWPLFLALAAELALLLNARTFRIVCIALLLALTSLTLLRNQVYVDEVALWEDTARKSPHKARAHNNLGHAYKLAGRNEEARREFTLALRLDPGHIKARYNLEETP